MHPSDEDLEDALAHLRETATPEDKLKTIYAWANVFFWALCRTQACEPERAEAIAYQVAASVVYLRETLAEEPLAFLFKPGRPLGFPPGSQGVPWKQPEADRFLGMAEAFYALREALSNEEYRQLLLRVEQAALGPAKLDYAAVWRTQKAAKLLLQVAQMEPPD